MFPHSPNRVHTIYIVKVTAKKGTKKVSKKLTAKVSVINAGLKFTAAPTEMVVGAEENVTTKKTPSVAKVTYTSSDEAVATVDATTGAVKAIKAGKATITATSDYGNTATTDIAVKTAVLKSVAQASVTTIDAVFAGDTKNIKTSDIKITNTSNNVVYAVKSVAVDAKDATKVTITTYMDMKDAKEYTVEYDGTVQKFTATDGVVATVGLEKTEIVAATATKINAVTKDANNVVLGTYAYNDASSPVTITINVTNGYTTNDSLYLNKVGDTATVDLVYHKGTYDATGKEDTIEVKGLTITAVAAETVTVDGWALKVTDKDAASFEKATETKLAVGDTTKIAYIQITNSKNEKSTNLADYSFSSSNNDALIVSDTEKADGKIALTPVKEGTSYIIVKDAKGNVVTTLAVTVVAARKAASLDLDKTAVTLSTNIPEEATVEATLKDQYGEKMAVADGSVVLTTLTYNDGKTTVTTNKTFDGTANAKFTLSADSVAAGTYLVKASVGNFSKTVTVTVQTADASKPSTYMLDMSANTADAVITADAKANTTITGTVYEVKAGVKYKAVASDSVEVTLKGADGKDAMISDTKAVAVSGSAITITVADKDSGAKLAAGSYTLKIAGVKGSDVPTFTRTIVITDSQPAVSVERVKTSATIIGECFKFTYEGKNVVDDLKGTVVYYNGTTEITGNGITPVSHAVVTFTLPGSTNKVQQKVNIGLTVTIG